VVTETRASLTRRQAIGLPNASLAAIDVHERRQPLLADGAERRARVACLASPGGFTNKTGVAETVIAAREADGGWRLAGYFIK